MPEASPNPELMRSLGKLVRGLSALFWGLPLTLVVCFHIAKAETLKSYHILPPIACTGLLVYALWLLGAFQKQERVWRSALDAANLLGLINFGLSPFLYWWNKMPENRFFTAIVILLIFSGLLFLGSLNRVLRRLGAMIPDEALRLETRQFTSLNFNLLAATVIVGGFYVVLSRIPDLPIVLQAVMIVLNQGNFWLLVMLVLLPLAMTMALIWKTKEVILDNVFGPKQ
ncbi:MAG TPA: hypothetical protein VJA21_29570 [Verrucomicrobiae bacterium]